MSLVDVHAPEPPSTVPQVPAMHAASVPAFVTAVELAPAIHVPAHVWLVQAPTHVSSWPQFIFAMSVEPPAWRSALIVMSAEAAVVSSPHPTTPAPIRTVSEANASNVLMIPSYERSGI
ncbi:MAG TPA: hypothetical protein VGH63_18720 [Polyangia bacterium]